MILYRLVTLSRVYPVRKVMRYKTFKQVLARQSGQVERLLDKVVVLQQLNDQLQAFLEPSLAAHCQVANLRDGCLVIMADSAAWATRLRYDFPDLLSRLRFEARLFNITSLHCIVSKMPAPKAMPTCAPVKLSAEYASLFADLAKTESDEVLAAALKKLAVSMVK